ncbi:MAG: NAD-dependent epimerase/dehydratase family protein [Candidatus Hydrogenedentes bacterium]|nr:NAD-dependent epimerase/dehydratase family protein [Candidatus Hydrogenedentota bacterium]
MAKILIAGCGYVGRELARLLLLQGHDVCGLRRHVPASDALPIRWIAGDLSTPEGLDALSESFDQVFYMVSADGHSPEAYRRAYVAGLRNLIARLAALGAAPARCFFVSSTGVYGQNNGEWLDESSPAEPRGFSGPILLEGEALLAASPFPHTAVRFSGIYGPGRERMIDSVRQGTAVIHENDQSVLNHIHRDDCAGFLAHLSGMAAPADLYLGTDSEPVLKADMLQWLAAKLGRPALPVAPAPPQDAVERSPRGGHRYYSNARMRSTGYELIYPGYREGYGALIDAHERTRQL